MNIRLSTHNIYTLFCAAILLVVSSCSRDKRALDDNRFADFARIAVECIRNGGDVNMAEAEILNYRQPFEAMLGIMNIDPAADDAVALWLASPTVTVFANDVDSILPPGNEISNEIAFISDQAAKEGIRLPVNLFATAIWGRPQSILFADSVMFIGLNHYLGSQHPAYAGLPEYRRASKTVEMMPYDIAEALVATAYPFDYNDSTAVVNRMIYDGALTAAKMALVKDAKLSEALGYDDEQLHWLMNNEAELWRKMVGSKMIFDRSSTVADRLLLPAPTTTLLSHDAPGRAGRFIGYRIVESYLKSHRDATISQLLSPEFYGQSNPLVDANYSPL